MPEKKPYTFDRVIRIGLTIALIWGMVWLLGYLSDVLIPFAIALLLAYLMNPLVVLIQKKVKRRPVAVALTLFIVFSVVLTALLILVPVIVREITHMGRLISDMMGQSDLAERASKRIPPDILKALKDFISRQNMQDLFTTEKLVQLVQTALNKVFPGVWRFITGTTSFVFGFIGFAVVGLYLVFLLLDFQKVRKGWKELLPPDYRETIVGFVGDFDEGMRRYFRGQALVALIVGLLFALGFGIIGLPLGILLGLFIGLLNMVPYFQIIGFFPAVLLAVFHALEKGSSIWAMIGLVILVFVIVQVIQEVVLVPRIMGKVTGLSPAMILLSLSVWGKLLGFFGLIIALPMTCLLLAYYKRFLTTATTHTISSTEEIE